MIEKVLVLNFTIILEFDILCKFSYKIYCTKDFLNSRFMAQTKHTTRSIPGLMEPHSYEYGEQRSRFVSGVLDH